MKQRIEELAIDLIGYDNGAPYEAIYEVITLAVNEALEMAAGECEKVWKFAPNDRVSGFRQNAVSHGCIASAEAIRKLKVR